MNHSRLFRTMTMLMAGMVTGLVLYFFVSHHHPANSFIYQIPNQQSSSAVVQMNQEERPHTFNLSKRSSQKETTQKPTLTKPNLNKKLFSLTNYIKSVLTKSVEETKSNIVIKSELTQSSGKKANDGFLVPPIMHYAWYSSSKLVFRFHHFISVLSAYKHIKPTKIMFWYDLKPQGPWWEEINKRVPIIELKYRQSPTEIFGKKIRVAEHQSDIVRLEAVMYYGGIYTDLDVVILKSFDPLRKFNTTMGYESTGALCNGIIVSAPNAPFLKIWHESYKSFNDDQWAYHSVLLPATLAKQHPALIHTEERTMHRPNWMEKDWLYVPGKLWDWSSNYASHLWYRFHDKDHNPEDIKSINTTMAQMFRYIYYGKKDIIKD